MQYMQPNDVVADLSAVLRALSDELRESNHKIGERVLLDGEGESIEPILFFDHAEIELNLVASRAADGKVGFWVLQAGAGATETNSIRLTLQVNGPEGASFGVGGR